MKKIFTPLLFLVHFPLSLQKKTKLDNFAAGLIFGAIFSLIVNLITIQIQETIQKQRILEAVENEILHHYLKADRVVSENNKSLNDPNLTPNYFHPYTLYSDKIWSNPETLKYIVQLNPKTQISLGGYYEISVSGTNDTNNKSYKLLEDKVSLSCYEQFQSLNTQEKEGCLVWYKFLLDSELSSGIALANRSEETLKEFHPTQDRLNSKVLRFLMGDEAINILKKEMQQ